MIAPFLIFLGLWLSKKKTGEKAKITIPWFAVGFIGIAGFNSFEFSASFYSSRYKCS